MLISPKCEMIVEPNMVFVVYVGLQGLTNSEAKDEQSKTSALLLSDTVLISAVPFYLFVYLSLYFFLHNSTKNFFAWHLFNGHVCSGILSLMIYSYVIFVVVFVV